jgi:hypothetical protein
MSVFCECCKVEVSTAGRSLVQRSVTECGVSESKLNTSAMRKPDLRTHDIKPDRTDHGQQRCYHHVPTVNERLLLLQLKGS